MRSLAALVVALGLAACASSPDQPTTPARAPVTSWVVGADGRAIGQALFVAAPRGTLIRLEFSADALPPGWHGLHIHEIGTCADVADGFRASGAHVGHGDGIHGLMNPAGPEPGDLPNLYAPAGAQFAAEFYSPWLVLGPTAGDGQMPLLDADGAALVIHAAPDDQLTQPIGGAGARIACAAVNPTP